MPKITDEMYSSIPILIKTKSIIEIADEFGVTEGTLRVLCSKRRISLRKVCDVPVALDAKTMKALRTVACCRGINATKLVNNLLKAIIKDNLYDAVLDDMKDNT